MGGGITIRGRFWKLLARSVIYTSGSHMDVTRELFRLREGAVSISMRVSG